VSALFLLAVACENAESPSPVGPSSVCAFEVAPATAEISEQGGTAALSVTTTAGCSWTASADREWITLTSGRTGSGSGSVSYAIAANSSTESRTAIVTVEQMRHTIVQRGAAPPTPSCRYELAPGQAVFGKDAADSTFAVNATPGCAWSAASGAPWLMVNAGSGSGNGAVSFSVARNSAIDARRAIIVVADQQFAVEQAGDSGLCDYVVAPVELRPCMAAGALVAEIATQAGCPWTVTAAAPWLSVVSGSSGQGGGVIRIAFPDNYDAPREGIVQVRWPTPTAGQNIRVMQAGCRYGVSQTAFTFTAAAADGAFEVLQQSDPITCGGATQDRCVWTARADVDWVTIVTGMPRAGDNRVAFAVAKNDAATPRTAHITVRDKVVTITQAGR
jgi:hypothetical protein